MAAPFRTESADPMPETKVHLHSTTDTSAISVPDPVTVQEILARRAAAGTLRAGIAAKTDSENFKDPKKNGNKPEAKRWSHLLTEESRSRKPSSLKGAAKFLANKGLISLGGGLPSSDYFPFESISAKVPTIGKFSEQETAESGQEIVIGKHDVDHGKSVFDLSIALNYGQGTGSAQMLRWVTEHTEIVHNPPYKDWGCVLTPGSSYPLEQVYRMFGNRGDFVLYEEFTFASAVETAAPLGLKPCGVKVDEEGLMPSDLDDILTNWDEAARGARKPILLYTVPSGQNPTGATQSESRRREVYKVCQKHNLIIIEDEPYFFLQMDPYGESESPPTSNSSEFLRSLVPSLLSMDTDGRVVRLDSFSKVVAPGSRMGWVVASAELVERFVRHNENSIQNPSGMAQIIMHRLLDETWGHEGYFSWLVFIRKEYTRRRNIILGACEKYLNLPGGVVSWTPPMAGMFLWIQIHPPAEYKNTPLKEIEQRIFESCIGNGVLLTPGSWFMAEGKDQLEKGGKMFFRATYAAASEEAMVTAISRFSEALRGVFGLGKGEE